MCLKSASTFLSLTASHGKVLQSLHLFTQISITEQPHYDRLKRVTHALVLAPTKRRSSRSLKLTSGSNLLQVGLLRPDIINQQQIHFLESFIFLNEDLGSVSLCGIGVCYQSFIHYLNNLISHYLSWLMAPFFCSVFFKPKLISFEFTQIPASF